jgi:transcriptional regulator with XRE-family HTH domain
MTKSLFSKDYQTFRELLVKSRKASGYTQTQVAEYLVKPQSYVSKYENGERRLDLVEFLEISRAIEIDPLEFIEELCSILSKVP